MKVAILVDIYVGLQRKFTDRKTSEYQQFIFKTSSLLNFLIQVPCYSKYTKQYHEVGSQFDIKTQKDEYLCYHTDVKIMAQL